MSSEKNIILNVMGRLLDYPDNQFLEEQLLIEEAIKENVSSPEIQKEMFARIGPLYDLPLTILQELYVETFDNKVRTNLYLTAHELGDSKKRGAALVQLQKTICEAGFDYNGKELADYIPMLLELLAVAPESRAISKLSQRLALAVHRITENLPNGNPYKEAIQLLMMYVFKAPESEELALLEKMHEEADLEELPYPLMYG